MGYRILNTAGGLTILTTIAFVLPVLFCGNLEEGANVASADVSPASPGAAWAKFGRKGKHTQSPAEEHFETGKTRMREGDLDGAIDAFLQASYYARNGYYPETFYWLGQCYYGKREDDKAIQALEKAREQGVDPNWDINITLAKIHLRNGRYNECDSELRTIRDFSKKMSQKVQFVYGLMCDRKKEYGPAEMHFYRALGDKPWKWTEAWLFYAEAKMKNKNWKEALREFRDLLKAYHFLKEQPDARIHHDIGVCKLAIGDHQGAIDHWHRSLDYDRNNPEVWLQLAMLLESEGHFSSAAKDYKEFLKCMPPESSDPRVQHVRDRLTKIEHKLSPNDAGPAPAAPSIYMRKQMEGVQKEEEVEQRQVESQQQETTRSTQDSGF